MKKKIKKRRGFTLIEVVAGLAIFAVISTTIMSMVLNVNKYNAENKNQFDASSMSRAFNETIKNTRPTDSAYPATWNGPDENTDGAVREYFIAFNTMEDLEEVINIKMLKQDSPVDEEKTTGTTNYWFVGNHITAADTVETMSNKPTAKKYKYGIRVKVQKKAVEKVYVFDTQTMDISGGITTITDRKFAISSIA